jgi:tryptophan synthase
MGVTGSSANSTMSASLPELCARVRKYSGDTPIAVGFGVNTREHFLSVGSIADGVVIGSKIVTVIKEAAPGKANEAVLAYCKEVSRARTKHEVNGVSHDIGLGDALDLAKVEAVSAPTATISEPQLGANGIVDKLESLKNLSVNGNAKQYEVPYPKIKLIVETPSSFW